jgi:hypothetical protein
VCVCVKGSRLLQGKKLYSVCVCVCVCVACVCVRVVRVRVCVLCVCVCVCVKAKCLCVYLLVRETISVTCLSPNMCYLQPTNRHLHTTTVFSLSISQSIATKEFAYFPRYNALLDSSSPYFVTSFSFLFHTCIAPPCSYFGLSINKAVGWRLIAQVSYQFL